LCCGSVLAAESRPASNQDVPLLVLDQPIERELARGETHAYRVTLAAGQYLRVMVEQRGVDLSLTLFGPDGRPLTEVDRGGISEGPEQVSVVAEAAGDYRLEVRRLDQEAAPGRYQVRVAEWR